MEDITYFEIIVDLRKFEYIMALVAMPAAAIFGSTKNRKGNSL
jgi:hypothetical protein